MPADTETAAEVKVPEGTPIVLLAFADATFVEMLIKEGLRSYTPFTLTAPDRLRRALAMTRLHRLAVSRWELEPDRCALAVPVFGPGSYVAAAIEKLLPTGSSSERVIQS